MKRGSTGRTEVTTVGGEAVRAFIPHPLPPQRGLALNGPIQPLLERSLLALGRLDTVSTLLPGTGLFLYAYVRKEAVLSSQIEGTQSPGASTFPSRPPGPVWTCSSSSVSPGS